ncbi:MAG: hypothetical protein JW809_18970 [Pirellulales bacterium]|nr:hypothetical protein [Pirellulales bacterium]
MVELDNLRVSLTKNGYMKIATIVAAHKSSEMLEHVRGTHHGVNLVRSQVANVLCADLRTGMVPAFWDEVRLRGQRKVQAFTFVAIVFAHQRLIETFLEAGHGAATGTILRQDLTEKEFTNLQFAMASLGLCEYSRGAHQIGYDMTRIVEELRDDGDLVGQLMRAKLQRCAWRDPDQYRVSPDLPLAQQCVQMEFHKVLGLTERQFSRWISGKPRKPR